MRPLEVWLYGAGLVLSFVAIVSLTRSIVVTIAKRKIVEERKAVQQEVQKKNEELVKQSALVESEYFVEREAREKLGLGREGESVVLLSPSATEPGIAAPVPEAVQETKSNFRLWWELFF
ncbi:septum formation initiator family protein [Candidatus Gottesmanbacteria bacterium]|nr:septum formation initiator family protein [Candidatus Gottesmanbacteria bacterium]